MEDKVRRVVKIMWEQKNGYTPPNETCFSTYDFDKAKRIVEAIISKPVVSSDEV